MKKRTNIFILAFIFLCGASALTANAADWTVTKSTNSSDGACDADCSLREAVAAANSGDRVVFQSSLIGQTFTLGGAPIAFVSKRIEIDGNIDGVNVAQISGSNNTYHFDVRDDGALTLKNITLVLGGGQFAQRGSILAFNANLYLDRVSIRNNDAAVIGAIELLSDGGNPKTHVFVNSSITSNTTHGSGNQFAAVITSPSSSLYMANTTISNNRTLGVSDLNIDYGAIYNAGRLVMRNCTITANEGNRGGGISSISAAETVLDVGNTIIAGNSAAESGPDVYIFNNPQGTLTSRGGNLIGNTQTVPAGIFNKTKDVTNTNPLLAPTNSNQGGHPIFTHPLQAGSPAIGGGINSLAVEPLSNLALTQDARGAAFPRIAGTSVDKGAFEDQTNGASLVVTKLSNSNDDVCDTDCSLREAVAAAGVDPGTDTITMAANVFGTMTLGGSEIAIENQDVNIVGYPTISSGTLIVSGGNTNRVFRLNNANVAMTGFTIANGNGGGQSEPFGGGGLVAFGGSLTLNQMIVRNNSVSNADFIRGGGIAANQVNVVRIMNSTINNNSAPQAPAVELGSAVAYITNTTITINNGTFSDGLGAVRTNGALYMRNSTVANNRLPNSTNGAGLYCGANATCNIGNSIFSANSAADENDLSVEPGGTLTSVGGNLVTNPNGFNNAALSQVNDQIGAGASLMSLADNGGSVPTMMPAPGSAVINTGVNNNATDPYSAMELATDARGAGYLRIVSIVDKGAFESLVPTAAAISVSGRVSVGKSGLTNAKVYLTDQHGNVRAATTSGFGYYKFENVPAGETYIVTVVSKRYQFDARVISANENMTEIDFNAEM